MSERRKRSDSSAAAVAAFKAAATEGIEPPKHLKVTESVRPFWDDIIATRALDSWTPNDLIVAATLARVHCDIERYSGVVERSSRITNDNGRARVSPVHRILVDLVAQAQSLSRSLQVHARATQGESRDQVKRNALYQQAKAITSNLDDDLIAMPIH